jgi:hypothetical protein
MENEHDMRYLNGNENMMGEERNERNESYKSQMKEGEVKSMTGQRI